MLSTTVNIFIRYAQKEKNLLLRTTLTIVISTVIASAYGYAGQYFQCNEMDHFAVEKPCKQEQTRKLPEARPGITEENSGFTKEQIELWAEPTVDSSGKVVSKLPPLPAMRFLSDPTPENAKTYMEWNKKRLESIEKSQALIQLMSGTASPQNQKIDNVKDIKSVYFFFSPT